MGSGKYCYFRLVSTVKLALIVVVKSSGRRVVIPHTFISCNMGSSLKRYPVMGFKAGGQVINIIAIMM